MDRLTQRKGRDSETEFIGSWGARAINRDGISDCVSNIFEVIFSQPN